MPDSHLAPRRLCSKGDQSAIEDGIEGELEFAHPPLSRGRHQLTPDEVAENQRQRLRAALADSVAVRGYAATSVDRVLKGSGVSRGTFYELFDNRQECLIAAHDASLALLVDRVSAACAGKRKWTARVSAAIYAAVDFAVQMPNRARLLTLDAFAADAEASRRGLAAIDRFASMLRSGREHYPKSVSLPEVTEPAVVGSVTMAINQRLLSGESPAGLESQLVYLVLAPYVGVAAASRAAAQS